MRKETYDLVIVGGGPAGLAAAIQARLEGIQDILLLERERELGGILQQCIHTGFGLQVLKEELTGPEYAQHFIDRLMELDIETRTNTQVLDILKDKTVIALGPDRGLGMIHAKAIVLAMGCRERTRPGVGIPGTRPAGIYTAGTAQRLVNIYGYMPGKECVILGSGDIGLIMARRLTLEGAVVKGVVEIMPYSSGLKRNILQCLEDFDIPLLLEHTISEIHGRKRVEGVTIARVDKNWNIIHGTERYISCDTVLISAGLIPENELSEKLGVEIDPVTQGPVVNEFLETSCPGVFACGNVLHVNDLVDNVTREGMVAGKGAVAYIKGQLTGLDNVLRISAGDGIRYVVPQRIMRNRFTKSTRVFFRVKEPHDKVQVIVLDGDKVVGKSYRQNVTPGQILYINLTDKMLDECCSESTLTISAVSV